MTSNVISLSLRPKPELGQPSALLQSFAKMRRDPNDVFWLKENAELLNILECSAIKVSQEDLTPYVEFYENLPDRLAFFPQYYRFFASIALDLEALGIEGDHAQTMCESIHQQGLIQGELSDLQRAEAARLLMRRGLGAGEDADLRARLHRFIDHSATFALPNRKAAYELTHIVFYLSEYGRRDPSISEKAIQSLMFCGTLAHLDQNTDLLAEVCIALRYAGKTPPSAWERWIKATVRAFDVTSQDAGAGDRYHEYLVSNWAIAQMGDDAFAGAYCAMGTGFYSTQTSLGALGAVSEVLLAWDGARVSEWDAMKRNLFASLDDHVAQHLRETEEASSDFEAFFGHFVRAPRVAPLQTPSRQAKLHQLKP